MHYYNRYRKLGYLGGEARGGRKKSTEAQAEAGKEGKYENIGRDDWWRGLVRVTCS